MKTLYCFFVESICGEVWVDENINVIAYIHENDGDYRHEYYNFIPEFFGGKIARLQLPEKILESEEYFDDVNEFVKKYKKQIKKAIERTKK